MKNAILIIYHAEGLRGFTKGLFVSFTANSVSRSIFFYL